MNKRKNKRIRGGVAESDGSFELDLSPMLALMVCLIPIMLLATALVQVKVIESPLPQVVKEAIDRDRNDYDQKPKLSLIILADKQMKLQVSKGSQIVVSHLIPAKEGKLHHDELYTQALKVKKSYPGIFHLSLSPDESIAYEQIVQVIDSVRKIKTSDPSVLVRSDKGEEIETDLLFPEVIFANVMEASS